MNEEYIITSKKGYQETMAAIYELMNKGEANLTESERDKLALMTKAAERYEDEVLEQRHDYKTDSLPDNL